jgi:hypothetical protein
LARPRDARLKRKDERRVFFLTLVIDHRIVVAANAPTRGPAMRIRIFILLLVSLLIVPQGWARRADEMETRTGRIVVSYPFPPGGEFSKLVLPISKRYGLPVPVKTFDELRAIELDQRGEIKPTKRTPEQDAPEPAASQPAKEEARYGIYVPDKYDPHGAPFGLMVWISPGEGVGFQPSWREVLDKHQMIFIAPHDVPNQSHVVWRVFMATESVRQSKRHFNIDPDRVYVSGFSGGGRVSSHTAMFFPDVFGGCFAMCGSNFYRDVPAGGNKVWPGFWRNPEMNLVKLARTRSRFVLLTGALDFNRESTQAASEAMQKDKFAHVTYLEVPGADHNVGHVDGEWFEKGVAALDAPVFEEAEATYQNGINQERQKKLGEALLAYESAARHGKDQAWVKDAAERGAALRKKYDAQLTAIRKQIDERKFDEAAPALRQFKSDFSPVSSDPAAELLEKMRLARGGTKSGTTKPSATVPPGAS